MVFSRRGRLGRKVVELDAPPLKEYFPEPNWSTHDLINIAHIFLTQLNEKLSFLIVKTFQIWKRLSLEVVSSQSFGGV